MKAHLFGKLAERAARIVEIDGLPANATIRDVRALLSVRFPSLAGDFSETRSKAVVGDEMVGDTTPIAGLTAVEFFPPLSGG